MLALLVGRVTTIKLAYWAALMVFELALPLDPRPRDDRFVSSVAFTALATRARGSATASTNPGKPAPAPTSAMR